MKIFTTKALRRQGFLPSCLCGYFQENRVWFQKLQQRKKFSPEASINIGTEPDAVGFSPLRSNFCRCARCGGQRGHFFCDAVGAESNAVGFFATRSVRSLTRSDFL